MGITKHNLKTVLAAIEGSHGVKKTIATRLRVDRRTVDNYLERWATAADAFEEEKSAIDDEALSVVIDDIVDNRDVSTAKWWLAKKVPDFGEKLDLTSDGERIGISYVNDWRSTGEDD